MVYFCLLTTLVFNTPFVLANVFTMLIISLFYHLIIFTIIYHLKRNKFIIFLAFVDFIVFVFTSYSSYYYDHIHRYFSFHYSLSFIATVFNSFFVLLVFTTVPLLICIANLLRCSSSCFHLYRYLHCTYLLSTVIGLSLTSDLVILYNTSP